MERVEAVGIFRNVRRGDVERVAAGVGVGVGGEVRLRTGWVGLVERVQRGGKGRVGIVSVAWSRRFIHAVLSAHVRESEEGKGKGKGGCRVAMADVEVQANEIAGDGSGMLDRVFGWGDEGGGGLWTAGDKERVMREMVDSAAAAAAAAAVDHNNTNSSPSPPSSPVPRPIPGPRTIYIGDSPTDLACLVKADVGICIHDPGPLMTGEQRELESTLERIGWGCLHVGGYLGHEHDRRASEKKGDVDEGGEEVGDGSRSGQRKLLWWATDFDEVCRSGVV